MEFLGWNTFLLGVCVVTLYLAVRRLLLRLHVPDITSRHVFITGCDTGFGHLLACSLDSKGVIVIAGCLTADGASTLQAVTSSRLKTVSLDVADDDSVAKAYKCVMSRVPQDKGTVWQPGAFDRSSMGIQGKGIRLL